MIWTPFLYVDTQDNQTVIQDYIMNTQACDFQTQMQVVQNFISHFYNQNLPEADRIFVHHFPNKLYEEFVWMSRDGKGIDSCQEKILLFDIFTFIFRNANLLMDSESQPFIEFFLKFIESRDISGYNPDALIYSIMICVSYYPNKVKFIEENGMFNFYFNFIKINGNLAHKFWIMCEDIYELDRDRNTKLSVTKLNKCQRQIMTTSVPKTDEECARLLFTVFKMFKRQRLLNVISFDVNRFYAITVSIFDDHIHKYKNSLLIVHLQKIWGGILNRRKNSFQIDLFKKLKVFAALFSINISNKLKKDLSGSVKFEVTNKIKQKLYIIYLTLVAFPVIDHQTDTWLVNVLIELHMSFQEYLQNYLFKDLPFESQFIIIKYYIKSHMTINLDISSHDSDIINGFLHRILLYPTLSNIY
ncbi:hypothetical protein RF11_12615 [Thelohanellus kitauei]|uniref:Uncharacterized protein n=1 Tax=Thelohanellus kitauei TaxID=669202 RepID=A0A0C2IGR0_THEKT|nr:hypothetical protein RF11_12615 [Thelohanellus kitauei]